jgi:hypothetical protein
VSHPEEFITDADEAYEWRDRADAAEADVIYLRRCLSEYVQWLASPDRGPVIFRFEVAARLREILAP